MIMLTSNDENHWCRQLYVDTSHKHKNMSYLKKELSCIIRLNILILHKILKFDNNIWVLRNCNSLSVTPKIDSSSVFVDKFGSDIGSQHIGSELPRASLRCLKYLRNEFQKLILPFHRFFPSIRGKALNE